MSEIPYETRERKQVIATLKLRSWSATLKDVWLVYVWRTLNAESTKINLTIWNNQVIFIATLVKYDRNIQQSLWMYYSGQWTTWYSQYMGSEVEHCTTWKTPTSVVAVDLRSFWRCIYHLGWTNKQPLRQVLFDVYNILRTSEYLCKRRQ
jgi:hypothetical protein